MHFFEIDIEDSTNHVYDMIGSYRTDSTRIERVFNLENQLIQIKRSLPKLDDYQELTVEKYDGKRQLTSKTTANLTNGKFITSYFDKGEQIAQVRHQGEDKHTIYRKGYNAPKERLENDFEPRPKEEKTDIGFFLRECTKYDKIEWPAIRQHVDFGVHVDELGEVKEIVWSNSLGCEKRIAEKYLNALRSWKKGFHPALNESGKAVSACKYYLFYPGGRLENAQLIVKFNIP